MSQVESVRVLFVCMGNICRSPTAQGLFRRLLRGEGIERLVQVDSAGTHAYHVGEPPDRRAQEAARRRGVDLSSLRARRIAPEDFAHFDYILAMDQDNYLSLLEICPPGYEGKLQLYMDYAPELRIREVPDPYYGGPTGFERVFDLLEAASEGLLADIRRRFL